MRGSEQPPRCRTEYPHTTGIGRTSGFVHGNLGAADLGSHPRTLAQTIGSRRKPGSGSTAARRAILCDVSLRATLMARPRAQLAERAPVPCGDVGSNPTLGAQGTRRPAVKRAFVCSSTAQLSAHILRRDPPAPFSGSGVILHRWHSRTPSSLAVHQHGVMLRAGDSLRSS